METKAGIILEHATMALHAQRLQTAIPWGDWELRTKTWSTDHPCRSSVSVS